MYVEEIYYKELAHGIMEAGKSKILSEPVDWRPRRANSTVPGQKMAGWILKGASVPCQDKVSLL